jgi:hypothetical protein
MASTKNGPQVERCGAKRIADERERQMKKEGWDAEHDDGHVDRELALAAICYAAPGEVVLRTEIDGGVGYVDTWPNEWDVQWDKRPYHKNGAIKKMDELPVKVQIRMLEKAGALIAAEIDRLLRADTKKE